MEQFHSIRHPSGRAIYLSSSPCGDPSPDLALCLPPDGAFWYLLPVLSSSQVDEEIRTLSLRRALASALSTDGDIVVMDSISWSSSQPVIPGFVVQLLEHHIQEGVADCMVKTADEHGVSGISRFAMTHQSSLLSQAIFESKGEAIASHMAWSPSLAVPRLKPWNHPHQLNIYPTVESCVSILQEDLHQIDRINRLLSPIDMAPPIQSLLSRYHAMKKQLKDDVMGEKKKGVFVCIEGLDGTGKSTLVQGLCREGGYQVTGTPGVMLDDIRPAFDKCPLPHIRRAFYFLSLHLLARDATVDTVCDRYVYSSIAYAGGSRVHSVSELPDVDDAEVSPWKWPSGLPVPSLVVVLTASSTIRHTRIQARAAHIPQTEEEHHLSKNVRFAAAVSEAYLRCCEHNKDKIPYIVIDSSHTPEEVRRQVLEAIQHLA